MADDMFAESLAKGWVLGEIRAFAFPYDPSSRFCQMLARAGWMYADGRSLTHRAHHDLWEVIQNRWGTTEAGSQFNIPDLRGRFIRGDFSNATPDDGVRASHFNDQRAASNAGGEATGVGSLQMSAVGPHRNGLIHGVPLGNLPASSPFWAACYVGSGYGEANPPAVVEQGLETRPQNVALSYWIFAGRP
ncbi:MAG: tail fiber protein [Rhodospirillales bacterium]|nr:MAG: tail fiber protein [Rhodospirillales bacterium]